MKIKNMVEIPEQVVRESAQYIPQDEKSGIRTVLEAADEFKAANMTPIFILDRSNMTIVVVAEETFGKKLH